MKPNTEYRYTFENVGSPGDRETGVANQKGIAQAMYLWLARVSMNNKFRVTIERDKLEGISAEDQAALDSLFEGIE